MSTSTEIALTFGFEPAIDNGIDDGIAGFKKASADGGYYLAFLDEGAKEPRDSADPEAAIWNIGRFKADADGEKVASIVVMEALPLHVCLSSHEMLPEPGFDKRGEANEEVFNTFTDFAFRDVKGKSSWDKMVRTLKDVPYLAPVFEEGFTVTDTGGGCLVFVKDDPETGGDWMVACDDKVFGHPLRGDWSSLRNIYGSDGSASVCIERGTLVEFLERYKDIPAPDADAPKKDTYIPSWRDLDDVLAERASAAPAP